MNINKGNITKPLYLMNRTQIAKIITNMKKSLPKELQHKKITENNSQQFLHYLNEYNNNIINDYQKIISKPSILEMLRKNYATIVLSTVMNRTFSNTQAASNYVYSQAHRMGKPLIHLYQISFTYPWHDYQKNWNTDDWALIISEDSNRLAELKSVDLSRQPRTLNIEIPAKTPWQAYQIFIKSFNKNADVYDVFLEQDSRYKQI